MSQLILVDDSTLPQQFFQGTATVEPTAPNIISLGGYSGQILAPVSTDITEPTVLDTLTTVRQDTSGMSMNQGIVSMMQYHHYF